MLETLYKTRNPEELTPEKAEYYELILDQNQAGNGLMIYFVREMHGWWSEEDMKAIHHLTTLSPEEGYRSWQEAYERYKQQRASRALSGFVHSFSPHYYGERKYEYELIQV
jgi:NADH:ubiquinone oxidoreductase subunit E